jgi:hypothetical protein
MRCDGMKIEFEAMPGPASRTKMVLDLRDGGPPDYVVIRRGGMVVGEITLGVLKGQETLWDEVVRARRLEALPHLIGGMVRELTRDRCIPDHVNKGPKAQREAFYAGLVDGLRLKTEPYPMPGIPDILPDHSPSYREGYSCGEAITRTVGAIMEAKGSTPGRVSA